MELQSIKNRFGIIGNDPALNYALEVADQVANTDLSVLILGESGVGKEVFSQVIHNLSQRKHNNFIAVNCGAIPEGTIDSELFGHEKGAFTSAGEQRKGYFETVNGGTIFLDEIGEMPLGTQARLLRVLETGEYIRVGSSKVMKTDVRVIAATNKDLLGLAREKKFREDLYYRLNTVPIRVPSLKERRGDINLLFRKFCIDFADRYKTSPIQLDEHALNLLTQYNWPGNVRELKNMAEQISVLSPTKVVTADALAKYIPSNHSHVPTVIGMQGGSVAPSHNASSSNENLNATEREILYKLFFELKKDMNDVKQALYDLVSHQGFDPTVAPKAAESFTLPAAYIGSGNAATPTPNITNDTNFNDYNSRSASSNTVIINPNEVVEHHEDIEESLSLIDREKEFIVKALQKHKGKRKDAAQELGISERTLYRKIKEYDIDE